MKMKKRKKKKKTKRKERNFKPVREKMRKFEWHEKKIKTRNEDEKLRGPPRLSHGAGRGGTGQRWRRYDTNRILLFSGADTTRTTQHFQSTQK